MAPPDSENPTPPEDGTPGHGMESAESPSAGPDDSDARKARDSRLKRNTRRAASAGQFVLRGLAISLPPILTLVILIWVTRGIYDYIIGPASATVRYTIGSLIDESVPADTLRPLPRNSPQLAEYQSWVVDELFQVTANGQIYVRLGQKAVPADAYAGLAEDVSPDERPRSATSFYMMLAERQYFGSFIVLNTLVLACIVVLLYFLGRFVTARIGTWVVHRVETQLLGRLPVVRNVYGSVKQVTDFLFSENEVEYRRVVAIEYPRRGIWSLGLVTGESMLEVATFAGEPCVSVLIPSSPMPVTGYTISVPRSAIVDLDLSVDQAFQFCISCGVLVPPQQKFTPEEFQKGLAKRLSAQMEATASRLGAAMAATERGEDTLPPNNTPAPDGDPK